MNYNFDELTLTTPRIETVTNFGVESEITIAKTLAGGINAQPNGIITIRLNDFPQNQVILWEGEEGLAKIQSGYTRIEALARAVEVLG